MILIYFIVIIFTVSSVLLLPQTFIEKLYLKIFESERKRGERLFLWLLGEGRSDVMNCRGGTKDELPRYKFYTDLLVELLDQLRRFGGAKFKLLFAFKKQLKDDLQFEKRISSLVGGGVCQFLLVVVITWGFIALTCRLVGYSPSLALLFLISLLHLSGVVLFLFQVKKMKVRALEPFMVFYRVLIIIKLSLGGGLSVSESLRRSRVEQLFLKSYRSYPHLIVRVDLLIKRWQTQGGEIAQELDELMDELLFQRDEEFLKLNRNSTALKFLILALFYLSSYLLFVFTLLSAYMF